MGNVSATNGSIDRTTMLNVKASLTFVTIHIMCTFTWWRFHIVLHPGKLMTFTYKMLGAVYGLKKCIKYAGEIIT